MRALVTGASGFLGGRLVALLRERGDEVTVLARPAARLDHLPPEGVEVVRGGLTDAAAVEDAVAGADMIYHCAAASTDWASAETYYQSNVAGTETLLRAATQMRGLRRFLHVSTTDVYGYPAEPVTEEAPLLDAGLPYNQTKRLAELAVWRAAREDGVPVTVVRPATIYGPRGKAFVTDIAALLCDRLMLLIDGGRSRGGFIYVDDVAEGMMAAAAADRTLGEAYNLCGTTGGTWSDYAGQLADGLGLPRPWLKLPYPAASALAQAMELPFRAMPRLGGRPLLTRHAVVLLGRDQEFPIGKAMGHFGFKPRIGLEEGVRRSAAWLRGTAN